MLLFRRSRSRGKALQTRRKTPPGAEVTMSLILTTRDLEILRALTRCIRVLTLQQIARTWWADSKDSAHVAENRLQALRNENLLHIERSPAHPELDFDAAVAS